jgi:putative spermidine/putrescine transport system permease protein
LPGAAFFLCFFLLPLGVVVLESASEGIAAYRRVFDDPAFWAGLRGTLVLGTLAPLFSLFVGTLVARHLVSLPESRRVPLLLAISLPLTFSGLIVAYGFILVFGRSGIVTLSLAALGGDPATIGGFIFSPAGLGFAYAYYLIPRVVMLMLPVLANFDYAQMQAAESLGASRLRAVLEVMLPQILPALVTTYSVVAAVAIGAYGTALALVGTQVAILPLVLYSKISETGSDFPAAAAASVILMGLCCLVILLAELTAHRRRCQAAMAQRQGAAERNRYAA